MKRIPISVLLLIYTLADFSVALAKSDTDPTFSDESFILSMVKMCASLLFVVMLAYFILQKGLGKWIQRQGLGHRMRVKERLALTNKNMLFIVQIDDEEVLLSTSDNAVGIISRQKNKSAKGDTEQS